MSTLYLFGVTVDQIYIKKAINPCANQYSENFDQKDIQ